jgi:hypothetical protein
MGIAVHGDVVYWLDSDLAGDNALRSCLVSGCPAGPNTLATNLHGPRTLVADDTHLYWTSAGGYVATYPLAGGSVTTLATGQSGAYFVAVHGTNLYWTNDSDPGTVMSIALPSGAPVVMASVPKSLGLAADDTGIYFTTEQGFVMTCPLSGCAAGPRILASAQAAPFAIVVDAAAVYWTNSGDGTVRKLAK